MDNKKGKNPTLDCQGAHKVLHVLEDLKGNPEGAVVYRQVEQILGNLDETYSRIARGYSAMVQTLLQAYQEGLPDGSLLGTELGIVRKRLQLPISFAELASLQVYGKRLAEQMESRTKPSEQALRSALAPLLGTLEPAREEKGATAQPMQAPPAAPPPEIAPASEETSAANGAAIEQHITSVYRDRLARHQRDSEGLQKELAGKVKDASRKHEEFGLLLDILLNDLKEPAKWQDTSGMREAVINEIQELINAHNALVRMYSDSQSLLDVVETNSQKLADELAKVRVLSLTDELTGLPNRRAFLRRLYDECGRAQRFGSPLALAMIDLDRFKNVNDEYGHAAGDEILRCFAREVLSVFRRYDMVSRYGGEEFAVVLPSTDMAGALRALEKVRSQAWTTVCQYDELELSMPTFSAGLAVYSPGETPEHLMARADTALYRAKSNGRNRIEMETAPANAESQGAPVEPGSEPGSYTH